MHSDVDVFDTGQPSRPGSLHVDLHTPNGNTTHAPLEDIVITDTRANNDDAFDTEGIHPDDIEDALESPPPPLSRSPSPGTSPAWTVLSELPPVDEPADFTHGQTGFDLSVEEPPLDAALQDLPDDERREVDALTTALDLPRISTGPVVVSGDEVDPDEIARGTPSVDHVISPRCFVDDTSDDAHSKHAGRNSPFDFAAQRPLSPIIISDESESEEEEGDEPPPPSKSIAPPHYTLHNNFISLHLTDALPTKRPTAHPFGSDNRVVDSDNKFRYYEIFDSSHNTFKHWMEVCGDCLVRHGLNLTLTPDAIRIRLSAFPSDYLLVGLNKVTIGNENNPRVDLYLYGSKWVTCFRSPFEFAPHALWILGGMPMREDGKPGCRCKYCRRDVKSQKEITRMFFPQRDEGEQCVLGKRKRGSQQREKGVIDVGKAKDYRVGTTVGSNE